VPQFYPVVLPAGNSVQGASLGFHAYSLRIDNLTNQWLLEETSLAWIPPYSLGTCLRLYGTSVALLLNRAPTGQAQLAPITGEEAVGVYSDLLRTEVASGAVRQFSLVQTVSDLTQGPAPATPPVGITRLWAASDGTLHYSLSSGANVQLVDSTNVAGYVSSQPLGGDLYGTVNAAHIGVLYGDYISLYDQNGTLRNALGATGTETRIWAVGTGAIAFINQANTTYLASLDQSGNLQIQGNETIVGNTLHVGPATGSPSGHIYFADCHLSNWNSNQSRFYGPLLIDNTLTVTAGGLTVNAGGAVVLGNINSRSGNYYAGPTDQSLIQIWNPGEFRISSSPGNLYAVGTVIGQGAGLQGAGAYVNTASSIEIKKNIVELDPVESLATILDGGIRPCYFEYIEPLPRLKYQASTESEPNPNAPDILWTDRKIGFLTEDVQNVIPEAAGTIEGTDQGYGLLTESMVPMLWSATRELERRIRKLEMSGGPQQQTA
jgi:hypothetical protein